MTTNNRLAVGLFLLRLTVLLVMGVWTADKLLNPTHAAGVYAHFYAIGGVGPLAMKGLGAAEALLVVGFGLGWRKRWTYGAVLVLHAVSTLSAFSVYLHPFDSGHLLFFAAWPMLAACFALYLLRDQDTLLCLR